MLLSPNLSRINQILFFSVLIAVILYFGKELFIAVIFSVLLAMLMTPLSNKLEKKKISRVFSSLLSVLIIIAVLAGIVLLLNSQAGNLREDFPQIKSRLQEFISGAESWINNTLGINSDSVKEKASEAMSNAGGFISDMLRGTFSFFGGLLLILVFTFLFLLHREKYENFTIMLFREDKKAEARKMIGEINNVARQYLTGRLISIFILAILYIIGFTIIGLKNAILLSVIAAIMSFIPYIGPLIGGFIPFFMALVSGDSANQAIWVIVILVFAQLFDNYFIEPYVVGGSVNISPFFTIFILLVGGAVWGIAGVILFLPMLGILRIIFERVDGLQPYAYLIGDQKKSNPQDKILDKIKTLFGKK